MATVYGIIENWSTKDQASLIAESELVVGNAMPQESLQNDMALLKFDEESSVFDDVDITAYPKEEIGNQLDTLDWTTEPSEGGEI